MEEATPYGRTHGGIAIIGAGAVGLCSALQLQREGHRVDVFDYREPGMGASLGNAGIIAASEVLPLARGSTVRQIPRMLLDPTGPLVLRWHYLPKALPWFARFALASAPSVVSATSRHLAEMLKGSVDSWQRLARRHGFEQLLETSGWLRLWREQSSLSIKNDELDIRRQLGVKVELVGKEDIADLEPALAPGEYMGALYPDAGRLRSPVLVMRCLTQEVHQGGGRIRRAKIRAIQPNGDTVELTDDSGEVHQYTAVIVAAGAWSRGLLRNTGSDVPLDTERGYHAMLAAPVVKLRRPITFVSPGFTLSQMEEGVRLTTGVEFGGLHAPANYTRLRRMVQEARQALPGLGDECSQWLGFRPSLPDSLPAIGRIAQSPRVITAFGHGHLGITLAPITAQLVADTIASRPLPSYAVAVSPNRF